MLDSIEATLSIPVPRTRSNNGYPIKKKHVVSNEVKDAIYNLAQRGATFLSINGNRITVRIKGELAVINVLNREHE